MEEKLYVAGVAIERIATAIASFFKQHRAAISLPELQQALALPLIEVWLGLLLGGYELEQPRSPSISVLPIRPKTVLIFRF